MTILTLDALLMGRDKAYREDYTLEIKSNLLDLSRRVNNLFEALQIPAPPVTSGWRPLAINMRIGGAKRSLHMQGKAVDLSDPGLPGLVEKRILENPHLLLEFGLWMEAIESTPNWIHLDTGVRADRLVRVFKP
jgi:uncharacterized protein YcbK (DUF882 family)